MILHALIETVKTWLEPGSSNFGGLTKRQKPNLDPPQLRVEPLHSALVVLLDLYLLYAILCEHFLKTQGFSLILARFEAIACGDPISCCLHAKDPANVKPSLSPSTVLLTVLTTYNHSHSAQRVRGSAILFSFDNRLLTVVTIDST